MDKMSRVAAYVPIKLNNSRTPGKNIRPFGDGTPLCQFIFRTLEKVKAIDDIYCFCSDDSIQGYLPDEVIFLKRSRSLDTADTQCHDLIRAFISEIDADYYVLCHATSPFIKSATIEKCLHAVMSDEYDSAFSGARVSDFLWKDGRALNFDPSFAVRTQELPLIYRETVGCYVFTKEVFLKRNGRVGFHPFICETCAYESIDIDYPKDFAIADAVYMHILKPEYDAGTY